MDFYEKFLNSQKGSFEQFDECISEKIINTYTESISEFLKKGLNDKDSAEIKLPHGAYTASVRKSGETSANINVALEFGKDFLKFINGDIDKMPLQESFDPQFVKIFSNIVAYGHPDPESKEGKEYIEEHKVPIGIAMDDAEVEYFLNEISTQIGEICKEYEKPDKVYTFDIKNHGTFEFNYGKDSTKTTAKFTADKVLKQALKNDIALTE